MNSDFRELLENLSAHHVDFLIVGGYAVVQYAEPRFTKDLDIWVGCNLPNAERLIAALTAFGAPLFGAVAADFATPGNVLQLGVAPIRIDILTSIDGVEFEAAWSRRQEIDFDGVRVNCISLNDLILNKESTPRARDKDEAAALRKIRDTRR